MKQEIKILWLNALRSGEYTQGRHKLNQNGKFCCLGVLCDLAVKAGVDMQVTVVGDESKVTYYDECSTVLPRAVKEWAGLVSDSPGLPYQTGLQYSGRELVALNDGARLSFDQIADAIEASAL